MDLTDIDTTTIDTSKVEEYFNSYEDLEVRNMSFFTLLSGGVCNIKPNYMFKDHAYVFVVFSALDS